MKELRNHRGFTWILGSYVEVGMMLSTDSVLWGLRWDGVFRTCFCFLFSDL